MVLRALGKATEVRPVHSANVPVLISANASGSFIVVSPVQPKKAYSPIDVTELGKSIEVILSLDWNAPSRIAVTM